MLSLVRVYSSTVGSAYVQFTARGRDPDTWTYGSAHRLRVFRAPENRSEPLDGRSEGGEGGKTVIALVFARADFAAGSGGCGQSHPLGAKWLIFGKIGPSHFELANLN